MLALGDDFARGGGWTGLVGELQSSVVLETCQSSRFVLGCQPRKRPEIIMI
jgi:hypothetical protein